MTSMDVSKKIQENGHVGNGEHGFQRTSEEILLGFNPTSSVKSRSLFNVLKCSMLKLLLGGADKVMIKDRRALKFKLTDLAKGLENDFEGKSGNSFLNSNTDYKNPLKVENFPSRDHNNLFPMNFIPFVMVLVVKILGLQFSLLVSFLMFPVWSTYFFFMFLLFPIQTIKQIRGYSMKRVLRIWGVTCMIVTSSVSKRVKAQKTKVTRIGWALFSSIYVCSMLLGLFTSGFFVGGYMVKHLVEKPIQTRENLNFDYSKTSPVAFVPLKDNVGDKTHISGARAIPYKHKLQLTVSLTVPESEYNQKLGVFQVRVDFLAANGNVTVTSSHPSMLRFKSQSIRLIETVLKSAPLLAGFQSESQILNIKLTEFTEGIEPTTCLGIMLEQRAEYHPGAGIPQIYAASLLLESELPKFKRFVWCWRRTIFVWISIMSFLVELVFFLAFLRPIIIPRPRSSYGKKNAYRKVAS